uniref:PDZ domain-containing protein n=1 Tax=Callorhinchus milii TaxID=7868 RepID=A0A4W3HEE5_CALMI
MRTGHTGIHSRTLKRSRAHARTLSNTLTLTHTFKHTLKHVKTVKSCCNTKMEIYCFFYSLYFYRKFTFNPKEGIDNPALVITDDLGNGKPSVTAPRVCALSKKESEMFGFYLRSEVGKEGHIIRQLDAGSPAEASGMRDGDRLLAVNGKNLEGVEHETAVTMIRAINGILIPMFIQSWCAH